MELDRQGWAAFTEVSRAVAERAITEREGCLELFQRTGGDPRAIVRALRAGVRLFGCADEVACPPAALERELRRVLEA